MLVAWCVPTATDTSRNCSSLHRTETGLIVGVHHGLCACVVRAGGTWQTYCDSADLSSNDPCIDQQRCWEAGSAKITHIGGDTDSVCVYASANELHLSNYILFVLQAINYPSMFLLFTALDNSFLRTY